MLLWSRALTTLRYSNSYKVLLSVGYRSPMPQLQVIWVTLLSPYLMDLCLTSRWILITNNAVFCHLNMRSPSSLLIKPRIIIIFRHGSFRRIQIHLALRARMRILTPAALVAELAWLAIPAIPVVLVVLYSDGGVVQDFDRALGAMAVDV